MQYTDFTSATGRGFNGKRQQQLQVHFTAAIRLSISQFFISRAQREAVAGVELSEWWLMRDLIDVWVSHTHTSTHLLAKLCSQMYMHIYTNGFYFPRTNLILVSCIYSRINISTCQHSSPSMTSDSSDEDICPPCLPYFPFSSPPLTPSLTLPVSSIIHKLRASPSGACCEWVLRAMMSVIAEVMEVTGISSRSWLGGLKGSFVKWAPGCRAIEQNSGSVGVQRLNPECVSKQWEGKGFKNHRRINSVKFKKRDYLFCNYLFILRVSIASLFFCQKNCLCKP